jgi:quercetin dioxygenase-like cupin family protein
MRARDIPAFLAGNVADYSGAIGNVKSSLDNIYEPRATSMGLYVSEAGGAVLPIHSDAEDVAAIELVGDREVEYYTGPDSPPTVVKLNPGDALIIPAGVRHRTRALSSSAQLCYAIKTSDAYQNSPANIERRIDHASLGDLLDITVIDCTEDTQLIATDTSEINIPRADATHYVKFFLVHAIGVC